MRVYAEEHKMGGLLLWEAFYFSHFYGFSLSEIFSSFH